MTRVLMAILCFAMLGACSSDGSDGGSGGSSGGTSSGKCNKTEEGSLGSCVDIIMQAGTPACGALAACLKYDEPQGVRNLLSQGCIDCATFVATDQCGPNGYTWTCAE